MPLAGKRVGDLVRARRLLEKAEQSCLVANSLAGERHLSVEIVES